MAVLVLYLLHDPKKFSLGATDRKEVETKLKRNQNKMEDLSSSLDSEDFKEEDPQKRMAKMADAIAELECYIESLGGKMLMCRRCLSASKEVELCARCGDHRCEWCKADRSDAACVLCGRWICEGCRRMKVCQICGFG